ncbi:MAG: thiosulfate sulfurtransferase GlpE [Planctomycetota bacterium]|jgi:thiosulfate sulfurtransferase
MMLEIVQIDVEEAAKRLESGCTIFMDVRDPGSYEAAHIPGAVHVSDSNIADFVEETPRDNAIVIYCYHGNMSRGGAAFLMENGFTDVASLEGGFEAWRGVHPHDSGM